MRFVFVARGQQFLVSSESLDLAWVPVADLATYSDEESVLRMGRKWLSGQNVTSGNE